MQIIFGSRFWFRKCDLELTKLIIFQICLVILSIGLVVVALYDVIFMLRVSGDPTKSVIDVPSESATTINNPGYRESRSGKESHFLY